MLRLVLTGLCALWLFACAAGSVEPVVPVRIDGMVMENQTQMYVTAVRLLVPVTGSFVSCGNIPPGSMCSTTFPEAAYSGNKVEITWSQGGQVHSTGEFTLHIPGDMDDQKPAIVRIVITGQGSAGALIVQAPDQG